MSMSELRRQMEGRFQAQDRRGEGKAGRGEGKAGRGEGLRMSNLGRRRRFASGGPAYGLHCCGYCKKELLCHGLALNFHLQKRQWAHTQQWHWYNHVILLPGMQTGGPDSLCNERPCAIRRHGHAPRIPEGCLCSGTLRIAFDITYIRSEVIKRTRI